MENKKHMYLQILIVVKRSVEDLQNITTFKGSRLCVNLIITRYQD